MVILCVCEVALLVWDDAEACVEGVLGVRRAWLSLGLFGRARCGRSRLDRCRRGWRVAVG